MEHGSFRTGKNGWPMEYSSFQAGGITALPTSRSPLKRCSRRELLREGPATLPTKACGNYVKHCCLCQPFPHVLSSRSPPHLFCHFSVLMCRDVRDKEVLPQLAHRSLPRLQGRQESHQGGDICVWGINWLTTRGRLARWLPSIFSQWSGAYVGDGIGSWLDIGVGHRCCRWLRLSLQLLPSASPPPLIQSQTGVIQLLSSSRCILRCNPCCNLIKVHVSVGHNRVISTLLGVAFPGRDRHQCNQSNHKVERV